MEYLIGFLLLTVAALCIFVACDHQDMDDYDGDI
jgi:hypothetical protein